MRTFQEYSEAELYGNYLSDEIIVMEIAYNAALAESKKHYEEEKIAIHEYYAAKIADLMGGEVVKPQEKNGGRLI